MKRESTLKAMFDIRRSELPLALLMSSHFFLVITSFWILKPIKKTLFIEFYDKGGLDLFAWHLAAAQAELLARALNMVMALGAVIVFTWLVRRFRRQQLTYIFMSFFLVTYIVYSFIIDTPRALTVWTFYLYGDLFSTLMVATFFAFLNDSVTPEAAKRLYGLVGVGGVAGGAFGSTTVRSLIATVPTAGWLWICVGLGLLILIIAFVSGRMVDRNPPVTAPNDAGPSDTAAAPRGNPATEGARLVFRSRYLLAIVGIVGLYEIVSAVMNFQFTSTVAHYLDGPAIGQQFATVFAITNLMSLCVQLFLTSFIMTRYGVGVALLVLPLATLATSVGFMVTPILWMGSLQNVVDNGFNYSINQSAKETLYVPLSPEVKYKAKAFIDMFVHRLAKAIAIAVSLGTTLVFKEFASIRWLSAFSVLIILFWLIAVRYAGRRFREMTEGV